MTTPRQATVDRDRLVKHDLRWALMAPLSEVYKDSRKAHATRFEELTSIVRYLQPDLWDADPTRALGVVMRKAVKGLPGGKPKNSQIDWEEVGEYLCGFKEKPPERDAEKWRAYAHYLDEMCKAAKIYDRESGQFRREVTGKFKEYLADALLKLRPKDFLEKSPSTPREATVNPALTLRLVHAVPPPAQPERLVEHDSPVKRLRRIAQVRLTFGVASLVLIGAALGWLLVPRLYSPSQVWVGPFRGLSIFAASSFRLIALIVCIAVVLVLWLLISALTNWRPLSRRRAVMCAVFGLVVLAPVYLIGAVEFVHRREIREAAALPRIGSDTAFLSEDQDFDRVNNPRDETAACTSHPITRDVVASPVSIIVHEGDLNPSFCDELNGVLRLWTLSPARINAYSGHRSGDEWLDFYAETLVRPYRSNLWTHCGLSVIPMDDFSTSRNFTLEVAQEEPLRYRAAVIEYKNRGDEQESRRAQQRSSLVLPAKVGDVTEFDQSPREGWLKLGVLREGGKYKLFVNDHLVLTHVWEHAPSQVHIQLEVHTDAVGMGYGGCSFEYFRQWLMTD